MEALIKKHVKLIFVAILLLAIFLRFYKLGEIPNGLNRDEASLGYTAYSILHSGKEEHGVSYPINIESFGDWKLPGYVYVLIPFIKIFGLNDWSVRLPSALSGVILVGLVFFLLRELLDKEKHLRVTLPFFGMLFFAISPWSVHFSRVAYEANVALCFFTLATLLFTKVYCQRSHATFLLPFSAFFFVLTMFTYHAYLVLTPLFVLFLIVQYLSKFSFQAIRSKQVIFSGVVFVFGAILFLFAQSTKSNEVKLSGLSIFSPVMYREELFSRRQLTQNISPLFSRIYASTPTLVTEKLIDNVFSMLDPKFLFLHGGAHGSHNITGIGNLFAVSFFFVIVGTFQIMKEKKQWQVLIIMWLMLSAIPALITIEANHSTRFSGAMVPLEIISAFGFLTLIQVLYSFSLLKFLKQFLTIFLGSIVSISVVYFVQLYFFAFPQQNESRWPGYMPKLTDVVAKYYQEVDQILMQGESSSPYIYFLLYQHQLWNNANEELIYYPIDGEGFHHVAQLGKIHFQNIHWDEIEQSGKTMIVVVTPKELPGDKIGKEGYTVIDSVSNRKGETLYLIIKIEGVKS